MDTIPDEPNKEIPLNTLVEGVPQISELQDIANKTQTQTKEYGVSVYETDGKYFYFYKKAEGTSIFEPDIPESLKGKDKKGVFIHFHPVFDNEKAEAGKTLHLLPSFGDAFSGDFAANYWSRTMAGYLNVASQYGLTLNIGVEGISREDELVRSARERVHAYQQAHEHTWKVLSGEKAGQVFVGDELNQAVTDKFSMQEDVLLISHTESLGTRYFLHLSWDKLEEVADECGGLENIFFGDGVDKLTKVLNLDVPHDPNVSSVAGKLYEDPKTNR